MSHSDQEGIKASGNKAIIITAFVGFFSAATGFGLSYKGLLPLGWLGSGDASVLESQMSYLDLPQFVLTIPGSDPKNLFMSLTIEAAASSVSEIKDKSPNIVDSFNMFLTEVSPLAFERRGVLDIIKGELTTRLDGILGKGGFNSLLVMEFRIQ